MTLNSSKIRWVAMFVFIALAITSNAQMVYHTKTGEKYHDDGCRYLSRSKYSISLVNAINEGYTACSVCKPPTKVISSDKGKTVTQQKVDTTKTVIKPQTKTTNIKTVTSRQCRATTQAGNRCKRKTTSASGKCWQHE